MKITKNNYLNQNDYTLSKINKTKPVILVDVSYLCYNRFYAIKKWWGFQNPDLDSNQQNWETNNQYMDKYKKIFFNKLENILKYRDIPYSNIIFAKDCRRTNIWRMEIYPQYKETREESHRKSKFNGHAVFSYTYRYLIPDFIKKHGIKMLSHRKAEGDDLIAASCKYLRSIDPNMELIILANDNDYMQLVDPYLKVINLNNKDLSKIKVKDPTNSKYELIIKILMGDKSDNIPSCYILTEAIKTLDSRKINSRKEYLKCYKFLADKYASDPNILEQHIQKYPNLIKDDQVKLSRQLIDFNYIPDDIVNYVNNCIKELYY